MPTVQLPVSQLLGTTYRYKLATTWWFTFRKYQCHNDGCSWSLCAVTLHWRPQKCINYVLQKKGNTVKAVPLRVAFIPHRTGTTKTQKKPRSCQPAAPKNEVSKEATQPLSNSHPQAQLVTAEPSSLSSVKSTSQSLFLNQGWGWGTHTEHKPPEEELNVPVQQRTDTPAAKEGERFGFYMIQQLRTAGQG